VPRAPRKIARFGESAQGPPILGPDELGRSMRRVRQGLAVALAAATLASEPTWAGGLVEEI
jgi:hypothetical protein